MTIDSSLDRRGIEHPTTELVEDRDHSCELRLVFRGPPCSSLLNCLPTTLARRIRGWYAFKIHVDPQTPAASAVPLTFHGDV
jgi:hypothetical protein